MSSKQNLSTTRTRVLALCVLAACVSIAVSAGTSSAALFGRLLPGAQSEPAPVVRSATMAAAAAPAPMPAPDEQGAQEPAFITTDRTDYNPGETVVITGSSFQPREVVTLLIKREGVAAASLQATADENGNVYNNEFVIGADDFGASFELTATGAASGKVAHAKFTDGTLSYTPANQNFTGASAVTSGPAAATASFTQTVRAPAPPDNAGFPFKVTLALVPNSTTFSGNPTTPFPAGFLVTANPIELNLTNGNRDKDWVVSIQVPANTTPGFYSALIRAQPDTTVHTPGTGTQVILEVKAPTPTDTTAPTTTVNAGLYVNNSWTNQDVTVILSATDNAGGSGVKSITYSINGGAPVVTNAASVTLPTFTAQGDYTISYFAIDNANNSEASANKSFRVKLDKTNPVITLNGDADVTIPFGSAPYSDPGATATDSGGSGLNGDVLTSGSVISNVVGDYALSYDVSDNAGNAADTVTRTVHVVKAEQTINFGPLADKTYGDPDFEVSATAGSGEPVSFSASGNCTVGGTTVHLTGAGNCTITASQAGNDNYEPAEPVAQSFEIAKAAATISVTGFTGTYDGQPHGATGTAAGVGGEDLNSLLDLGDSFTDAPGGTADWTFAGDTNYHSASGSVAINIGKAPSVTTVTCTGTHTYTGSPITPCSASVTGVGGLDLTFTPDYDNNVNAGTATASYTYGGDTNHDGSSDSESFEIGKADATVNVNGFTGVYDGDPHGATGTATGVNGESLSGLDLGATFTNVPGGTANWTFTGGVNYNDAQGSVEIEISKADATIVVTGFTGDYDGDPHGATGTATGVKGEALGGLDLGASFTNVPGGTASWTFTDATGNYHNASGTAEIVISKATPTITWSNPAGIVYGTLLSGTQLNATASVPGSLVYNPAAGTALGAGDGQPLNVEFTPADTTNYNGASKQVSINVAKAPLTVKADDKSKIFDGTPFTAFTVTTTGFVLGQNQSVLGGTLGFTTNPAGATAVGTYSITPNGLTSTNYAITFASGTLTIGSWTLRGFYQPVEMSNSVIVWNTIKGGSTVPLKFNIFAGEMEKTSTADVKSFTAGPVPCSIGIEDLVDLSQIASTGGTALRYDATGRQFIQNWQTPKQAGQCLKVTMTAQDGSALSAFFKTK